MKKIGLVLFLLLTCWFSGKAEEEVLLRVGGETILLSEFTDDFNRVNNVRSESLHGYFQYFLRYRLKVADAQDKKMDTLPDYRRQRDALQSSVLKEYFTSQLLADSLLYRRFQEETLRLDVRKWMKLEVLTFRLPQHYKPEMEKEAVRVMDELYARLTRGEKADDLLSGSSYGNKVVVENDGRQWTPTGGLLNELVQQSGALTKGGGYSKPFYSPVGIHVIRLADIAQESDLITPDKRMEKHLQTMEMHSPAFCAEVNKRWEASRTSLPSAVQRQLKQISDDLLALYWDRENQKKRKSVIPSYLLEAYFQAHKQNYRWEFPHFKGAVIHCASKKIASKIKKRLKKLPVTAWDETLEQMARQDSVYRTEREIGLFQIGKNKYVDRFAFKCGEIEKHAKFPYTFIYGKRLKDGPEDYQDVRSEVETDCRIQLEKDIFDALFLKFKVEINEDVLKSVNSCGNK